MILYIAIIYLVSIQYFSYTFCTISQPSLFKWLHYVKMHIKIFWVKTVTNNPKYLLWKEGGINQGARSTSWGPSWLPLRYATSQKLYLCNLLVQLLALAPFQVSQSIFTVNCVALKGFVSFYAFLSLCSSESLIPPQSLTK